MTNKADKEGVRASIELPNYKEGIKILRDNVVTRKTRISGIQGEIAGVWERLEKMGINKEGARIFLKLDGMQPHTRNDVLRTIQLMAEASDWDEGGDMVDKAGGVVVQMPQPGGRPPAVPATPGAPAAPGKHGPAPGGPDTRPDTSAPKPARSKREGKAPAEDSPDDDQLLAQADYKQVMADRIRELSDLDQQEAWQVAKEVWEDLPNRDRDGKRTRANAIANAEAEVSNWPEAGPEEGAAPEQPAA